MVVPPVTDFGTDIESWAAANDFAASDEEIGGATPLLRSGLLGTTASSYRGRIDDREALLAEFSIGSPDWSEEFGGSGTTSNLFTVMLVGVDATRWPRLTVHPTAFSEHDWIRRLLRADHEVDDVSPAFEEKYRVIASRAIPADQVRGLFTPELVNWWLAQPTSLLVDVEDHDEHGGYMTVAHSGLAGSTAELDDLRAQTSHLAHLLDP